MSFHPRTSPNRKYCNILHGFFCSTHSRHHISHQFSPTSLPATPSLSHSHSINLPRSVPPTCKLWRHSYTPYRRSVSVRPLARTHATPQLNQHTAAQLAVCVRACVRTVALKSKSAQPCLPSPPLDVISFNLQFRPIWYAYRWRISFHADQSPSSSSSSSVATTSPFESFGLLNYLLPLTPSCMHIAQLLTLIILTTSFISFPHLIFGLPTNLADIGFHSYIFLPSRHLSLGAHGQTSWIFGPYCNYILIYN